MEHILKPVTYTGVLVALIVLTLITVGVSFLPVPGAWHIVIGLIIGACKASRVVLFFMHAIASPRLTWIVIAVACFWLGILLVLTLTDYLSRELIPYNPGH